MAFVHHTDTATVYPCSDAPRIIRGIYAYHVLSNGWNDIGYNFLVDRCGRVYEGRYGGTTRPVIGAHTLGMNTSSTGIAMIGDFTSSRPTTAAVTALERLLAWRLDVAHVDPLAHAEMISGGNEYFHPGQHVVLRVISGHRDGSATSCPGAALYAMLPSIAQAVAKTGLPKIYYPRTDADMKRIAPGESRPVHFRARFSHTARWTLKLIGPGGMQILTRTGLGSELNLTWNGQAPVLPGGAYHWTLTAPGATSTNRPLGTIRDWNRVGSPGLGRRRRGLRWRRQPAGRRRQRPHRLELHDRQRAPGHGHAVRSRQDRRREHHPRCRRPARHHGAVELRHVAVGEVGHVSAGRGRAMHAVHPGEPGHVRAAGCRQRHHGDARPVQRRESDVRSS